MRVNNAICGTVTFNICYQIIVICYSLSLTCYMLLAICMFLSETGYNLHKLVPFVSCCTSRNFFWWVLTVFTKKLGLSGYYDAWKLNSLRVKWQFVSPPEESQYKSCDQRQSSTGHEDNKLKYTLVKTWFTFPQNRQISPCDVSSHKDKNNLKMQTTSKMKTFFNKAFVGLRGLDKVQTER